MTNWSIVAIPIIGATIGWFTNWVAIKMLFHPKEKTRFLWWEIQGVFPKRQIEIAQKIGRIVAEELLSTNDLKQRVTDQYSVGMINEKIETKIDEFLVQTMPRKFPLMSKLMPKSVKDDIRQELLNEVDNKLPSMLDEYVNHMEKNIDIEEMVASKFAKLSTDKLEGVMKSILDKEFAFIEGSGAVLGFLIGCIQALIALLPNWLH
jgi:uncharacterized membrane protein YheB (UPF0754 family)